MKKIFSILILLSVFFVVAPFSASAPPAIATIAALKALPPGAYPTVQLLGYNTAGDGGGGILNWISTASPGAVDPCIAYRPNSNPAVGLWMRPLSAFLLARQCGIATYDDTIAGNVTFTDLAGVGTRMVVADAAGEISTQAIPSGGSLANPTGTIGLTPVNGALTTGLRSDGAPALSQAIAPTWTALHNHAEAIAFTSNGTTGQGRIFKDATNGLGVRGIVGASYDFTLFNAAAGSYVMRNPTGGTAIEFPGSGVSVAGDMTVGGLGAAARELHVTGTSGTTAIRINAPTGQDSYLELTENNSTTAGNYWQFGHEATTNRLYFYNGATRLDISQAGAVGIPGPLNLVGTATLTTLSGSGTRMVVADASGIMSTQSIPAGASLANPTGTIGLTAVNGVLTSGLRSDGAPALSQAIVPTWTGNHTWAAGVAALWSGLGTPGVGNSEYVSILHDAGQISLHSRATGTGTVRPFVFGFGGIDKITFATDGDISTIADVHVSGSLDAVGITNTGGISMANNIGLAQKDFGGVNRSLINLRSDDVVQVGGGQAGGIEFNAGSGPDVIATISAAGDMFVDGKIEGEDTVAAYLGFRAGNTGASNVNLYRSGADMWTTPDSLTVANLRVNGGFGDIYMGLDQSVRLFRGQTNWLYIEDSVFVMGKLDVSQPVGIDTLRALSFGTVEVIDSLNIIGKITHAETAKIPSTLGSTSGTIAIDAALSDFYKVTLTGNATLGNPTNSGSTNVRSFTVRVKQDGTGSRTLGYGTNYRFPGGTPPVLTTDPNAVDYLSFILDEDADLWDFVGNAFNLLAEGT